MGYGKVTSPRQDEDRKFPILSHNLLVMNPI